MKRLVGAALAAALFLGVSPAVSAVGTSAASAVLMDADSGRVLYESSARQRRLIASTTKLMTALVALESGHRLDEVVTIAPRWAGAEGSSIYLKPGEQVRLETLLYGMLLRSGNDAALAVAGFCAGSVEAFVERMNRKAAELGMSDTHFENPNGLDGEAHYSSAYDMALLARACLKNETLANMVSAKSVTMEGRTFTNHNKLLWRYEGCIGLKTGYTEAAGRTLVSAARRDGMTLICVTLCDPDDWRDHQALFDFGFSGYTRVSLAEEGQILGRLPVTGSLLPLCTVTAAAGAGAALAPGEQVQAEIELHVHSLEAPVPAGTPVGEAVYTLAGEELARVPLVTGAAPRNEAPSLGLWGALRARIMQLSEPA